MKFHPLCAFVLTFIASVGVEGFTPSSTNVVTSTSTKAVGVRIEHYQKGASSATELAMKESADGDEDAMISRKKFMNIATVATAATTATTLLGLPFEASARGRATLEATYDRYYPRLLAGGEFYSNDLKKAIEKNDWNAIKLATQEPPSRSKADKSKIDGGVSERAAQAGGFSKARVITAADLWAASFSESSISPKTKAMKEQTAILAEVVDGMNTAAKIALGEEKAGGGFLGLGGKKAPSQNELAKEVRELYIKGGNTWNQYVYLANEGLPVTFKRLPYL